MPQLARPKPAHEQHFESAQELNTRERLLTAKDAAGLLRSAGGVGGRIDVAGAVRSVNVSVEPSQIPSTSVGVETGS